MEAIQHKSINVNGLNMHMAEMGQGPLVLLLHGFPGLWYSWRHQIPFLASHGYRVVAPDLRGYGDTTGAPTGDHTKFTMLHVAGDLIALVDSIKENQEDKIFVVGHDWGAIIAWQLCMCRPDIVKALVNLSVPYMPRHPTLSTLKAFHQFYGDDHYVSRFQVPGEIEAEFANIGTKTLIKNILTYRNPGPFYFPKGKGFVPLPDTPVDLPAWNYRRKLLTTMLANLSGPDSPEESITTGLGICKSLIILSNRSWELNAPWCGAKVEVPCKYLVGDLDLVYHIPGFKEYIHNGEFHKDVPLLEEVVVMEGVGHFINQEKAYEINAHILHFLNKF